MRAAGLPTTKEKMKIARVIMLLTVASSFAHAESRDIKRQVFGGEKNFAAFMSPGELTMERLRSIPIDSEHPYPRDAWDLKYYRRKSPVHLSPEQAKEVKDLFSEASAYEWNSTKACIPDYGVLLTSRSNPKIKIALCFECDMLAVYVGDRTKHGVNAVDSFDKISDRLLAIAKAVYPKDSELAHVKDKR